MKSHAANVDVYIAEAPEDRRMALMQLRKLIQQECKGVEEEMDYGMPSYKLAGAPFVSFASQKGYIALYGLGQAVLGRHREALAGLDNGKGCVRFKRPEQMNFELIRQMLRERNGA